MSKKIELCGYCADGHLHLITARGKSLKNQCGDDKKGKEDFRQKFHTGMFQYESFKDEETAGNLINLESSFVVLHPTHCPRKKFEFLKSSENEDEVPDNVMRFESDENDFEHPVVYLRKFEGLPGDKHRFERQTEEQCKNSLYQLIKGKGFTLEPEKLDNISYSELTQRFLREFWSCHVQKDLHNSIVKKVDENADLRLVINQWIWCLAYSTTYLSQEIVSDMKKHFPEKMYCVQRVLKRHENGVSSWSNFQLELRKSYDQKLMLRAAERSKMKYKLAVVVVVVTSITAVCLIRDYERHMKFLKNIFE